MTTAVCVVTGLLVIAKVAVVTPAATVTDAGTMAALMLLLVSVTTAPPAGAAAASVTVPVLPTPPVTEAGFRVTEASGGFTTIVTILDAPLYVAVMFTDVTVVTFFVVIGKVAPLALAATVTGAGTV